MPYLVDTNVLLRSAEPGHAMHAVALDALQALRGRGEIPSLIPQNLIEFWAVATRPRERNGLGLTPTVAQMELGRIEALFAVLPDSHAVYTEWRQLVFAHGVTGVGVYDTRLVAAMRVHGLTHLLTFNVDDFRRYPGVVVVHPHDCVNAAGSPPNPEL